MTMAKVQNNHQEKPKNLARLQKKSTMAKNLASLKAKVKELPPFDKAE